MHLRLAAQFERAGTCTAHLIYVLVPSRHLGAHENAMRTRNIYPDQNFSVNGREHLKIQMADWQNIVADYMCILIHIC